MEAVLALAAALVATGFLVDLVRSHLARARPHVAAWSAAVAMYAGSTWALFWGLQFGWADITFRIFYWFGAITNVLFLALGAAYLVWGPRVGGVLLVVFSAFGAGSGASTFGARFVAALPDSGVPAGADLFADPENLASPRLWAIVGNVVGTVLLVGLALYSIVRFWRTNRPIVTGNALIVAGTLAPVAGGTSTGLGEGSALALSLLVGAALLWAGFRVASKARRPEPVSV